MRRAQREGAADAAAQRDFAKADDMFLFGLLAAHMLFVALSAPGATDLPTLQRLVEVTFRNDFSGLRCAHHARHIIRTETLNSIQPERCFSFHMYMYLPGKDFRDGAIVPFE